jgi:hypothetical protein
MKLTISRGLSNYLICVAFSIFLLTGCRFHTQIVRDGPPLCCDADQTCESCDAIRRTNFSHGQPQPLVDTAGWILGIPDRVLMLDWRVENSQVGEQTERDLAQYLAYRNLEHTQVRINEYAPLDEWRRLGDNDLISPFWRYTIGTAQAVSYTLLPGRLFRRDSYNPYTDTISLYSDVPALAIKQAALAHNVRKRRLPGTYATFQRLPFVSLHQSGVASRDVGQYVDRYYDWDKNIDAHEVLVLDYARDYGNAFRIFGAEAHANFLLANMIAAHSVVKARGNILRAALRQSESKWSVSHVDPADDRVVWDGSRSATIQETSFGGGLFNVTVITPDGCNTDEVFATATKEARNERGDIRQANAEEAKNSQYH